ncbi:multiple epidermal growth factor-like domains protein 9 [Protopterus annectens]|uniref:multiple epidermal growth factor-like domains protein 9 n=1 Tax=Protopterus annectens TaxID=7888 RepID=UPI001CF9FA2E|nr:multiple epidermal growth factor-like domains protein 9 [Protopterus annectens]
MMKAGQRVMLHLWLSPYFLTFLLFSGILARTALGFNNITNGYYTEGRNTTHSSVASSYTRNEEHGEVRITWGISTQGTSATTLVTEGNTTLTFVATEEKTTGTGGTEPLLASSQFRTSVAASVTELGQFTTAATEKVTIPATTEKVTIPATTEKVTPSTTTATVRTVAATVSTTSTAPTTFGVASTTPPSTTEPSSSSFPSTAGETTSLLIDTTILSTVLTSKSPAVTDIDNEIERKGYVCNCSSTGSTNVHQCNATTGQCQCFHGYSGKQCEVCEDGFYHNSTTGHCLPCNCSTLGSINSSCNNSGRCHCKAGTTGLKCAECKEGFFRLNESECVPCQCNNHSEQCDALTGACLNCQGNTKGARCEECQSNFFRIPNASIADDCKQCPCSSVTSTESCHIESYVPVCDKCNLGYTGPSCNVCDNGYYSADSLCTQCNCSGKENPNQVPVCESETGRCLTCTSGTTGFHCENCMEGYIRDPGTGDCTVEEIFTTNLPTSQSPSTVSTSSSTLKTDTTAPPVTNSTVLTSFQTVFSTATNTLENSTSTLADVSWTQFNIIILTVIIVVVVLLMGFVGAVYMYREHQNRKLNAPFWTIELKEDNISFSSYHDSIPNADVSGLLEDDGNEVAPNGQLSLTTPMNSFKV